MVHAVSAYSSRAGATRVRLTDWLKHLDIEAVEHSYAGLGTNRPSELGRHWDAVVRAEARIRALDVRGSTVLLSREATPLSAGKVESRLLADADAGVFDFDDAIYLESSPYRRLIANPETKFRRAVQAADVVLAGNDVLAEHASVLNPNTAVIPSCVEPSKYPRKSSWEVPGSPTMIWIGSPGTERYVVKIMGALRRIHAQTGARLKLISGAKGDPALEEIADFTERVEWDPVSFKYQLPLADIALAPLDNTPWSRGKCAYKLLQYASSGLPMVGSPVGANIAALERFDGLAAINEDDWIGAIIELLKEPSARRRARAEQGWASVEKHYSFASWAPTWSRLVGLGGRDEV